MKSLSQYINEAKLIKPYYDPREVYIISTDSNRTIMSANAQIQGLYPPGTGPSIYPNQTERAVPPVNTEDIQEEIEVLECLYKMMVLEASRKSVQCNGTLSTDEVRAHFNG